MASSRVVVGGFCLLGVYFDDCCFVFVFHFVNGQAERLQDDLWKLNTGAL